MTVSTPSTNPEADSSRGLKRALAAAQTAAEHRGQDIVILDLRAITTEFDFFVVVTGSSRRQLHAVGDEINRLFKHNLHDQRLGLEGYQESRWILLDYGDIVVHLFDEETRRYYALEDLWCQAKRIPFEPQLGIAGQ